MPASIIPHRCMRPCSAVRPLPTALRMHAMATLRSAEIELRTT